MTNRPDNIGAARIEASPDEKWEKRVVLKDATGGAIGEAELDFEEEIIEQDNLHYRKLKKLIINPANGGEPVNILESSAINMSTIAVFIPGKSIEKHNFYRRRTIVMSNPIEDHSTIMTLLHEMGHAEQERDPFWEKVYRMNEDIKGGFASPSPAFFDWLFKTFPEAREILEADPAFMEYLNKVQDIQGRMDALFAVREAPPKVPLRRIVATAARKKIGAIFSRIRGVPPVKEETPEQPRDSMEVMQELLREKEDLEKTFNVSDILDIPIFAVEWNANERALAHARDLQGRGVDLLRPFMEKTGDEKETIKTIEKALERAVTYWIRGQKERKVPYPKNIREVIGIYKN